MSSSSVTIRVDEKTKKAAASIAEDFGFDLSSITRAFYRQIVREQRIPLNLEYPQPNDETLESLEETERLIQSKHPGYESIESMFKLMD